MDPETILFFGKPGAGKGTQMRLLASHLQDSDLPTLPFEWSPLIRSFMQGDTFAQRRAKQITDAGERLPAFLAPSLWLPALREQITGKEHLLIDGLPRHALEVELFDSLAEFYDLQPILVVHLDVPDTVAEERLIARGKETGRVDDLRSESIHARLGWFATETLPLLDFFASRSRYQIITLDGDRAPDTVQADIVAAISR